MPQTRPRAAGIVGRALSGGTVLGTVRVLPGRASVFRVELPPGGLAIRVELPEEKARKAPYVLVTVQSVRLRPSGATAGQVRFVDQLQGVRKRQGETHFYRAEIDGLHPGRYRVICGTATETVEVRAGVTKVVLRPPR